ncbi:hypothetical protein COLO4_16618 [Corchorus olitorius]|uniref:F-box domain-containing protein n=1 Tax=Corchorus olitorius TaxID=93759 RepID=A0A1R3JGN6_9ROSI|nr:hypothetical protein COLO4_16618 [Corchorus olitorius]
MDSSINLRIDKGLTRWEDLDQNILKSIFNLVPSTDLFRNVSRVCRSWQLACLDTLFWSDSKTLDLSCFSDTSKLKNMIRIIMEGNDAYGIPLESWRQSISKIVIPFNLVLSDCLLFIATRTPGVESLSVLNLDCLKMEDFARAMSYWKNITHLAVRSRQWRRNIASIDRWIEVIGKSCPQLRTLEFHGHHCNLIIGGKVALTIAKYLTKSTTLRFRCAAIEKNAVASIFRNCPELRVIHFSDCRAVYDSDLLILCGSNTFDCRSKGKGEDLEWCYHHGSHDEISFQLLLHLRLN